MYKKGLNMLKKWQKEKEQEEEVKLTDFLVTVQPIFKLIPELGSISISSLIKWA